MSAIHAVLRPLFDLLLSPLRGLPAIVGVTLFSLLFGAFALWLVKLTSKQEKVDAAKRKVAAGLLEIRLFNDNLGIIFKAIGSILKHQAIYTAHLLVSFLLMAVVFVLIAGHLDWHWGYRGLDEGDSVVFKVALQEGWEGPIGADVGEGPPRPRLSLDVPQGLSLTSPPVWSPSEREMAWRMRADAEGAYEVAVSAGDATYTKTVDVTDAVTRISAERHLSTWTAFIFHPSEPPLPDDSGLAMIGLEYEGRDVWFFFWRWHWIIVFLILSIVFALVLRGPMGVTI